MNAHFKITVLAAFAAFAPLGAAIADEATPQDAFSTWVAMPSEDLARQNGTNNEEETPTVAQTNTTTTTEKILNSPIKNSGTMTNGDIGNANVTGNRGIVMFTQNTGDLVNITKTMNVNVYLH
jgi:hypothetical protein